MPFVDDMINDLNNIVCIEKGRRAGILRIDLHVHSCYSYDCLMKPTKMIEVARSRGLAGVAVVDHDTVRGGLEARDLNRYADFIVIPGSEVKTTSGEVVGLFLEKEIGSRVLDEVVEEIHSQGGIAILPHPRIFPAARNSVIGKVDGVEVFNARYGSWDIPSGLRSDLARVGSSDAHFLAEIGNGFTLFQSSLTTLACKEALRSGRVSWGGRLSPQRHRMASQAIKAWKLKRFPSFAGALRFLGFDRP